MRKDAFVYKPVRYFVITFLFTWTAWFLSAFLSFQAGWEALQGAMMGIGLLGPLVAALWMVYGSKISVLKQDFANKLTNLNRIQPIFLPVVILLMPLVMVLSILLSTAFGQVIPMTIITNWLYYKNNRSIIAAIVFHAVVVVSSEMFQAVDFTKCIVTVVLAMIAVSIVLIDSNFFFNKNKAVLFTDLDGTPGRFV
ncbi:hypothetical protein GTO91_05580 [Heliobacterium undosum]|uniref:Uncharacterized protein n=1 Tax=Heliomicrobium undosum TaxID=121734 RepID=A0A845KYX4_9FIRM|nr:hypothetical protein [Heliomicrobium undosum]MZP29177.1 hypothetical protein [Heliomicrobium undosum]